MKYVFSLLILFTACGIHAQNFTWKGLDAERPTVKSVSHTNGVVTIVKKWSATQDGEQVRTKMKLKRVLWHTETTEYKGSQVHFTRSIDSVNYIGESSGTVKVADVDISDSDTIRFNCYENLPTAAKKPIYFDSLFFQNNSAGERQQLYRRNKWLWKPYKFGVSLGVSYMPSIGGRFLHVSGNPELYNSGYRRSDSEHSVYAHAIEFRLNLMVGPKHTIQIIPFYLTQGFAATGDSVSFVNGLPYSDMPGERKYQFRYLGLSIGYQYTGINHRVNPVVEVGAYHLWLSDQFSVNDGVKSEFSTARDPYGLRLGLGANVWLGYCFDIHLIPTWYCNLNSVDQGAIRTSLYNIGLNIGGTFYLSNLK